MKCGRIRYIIARKVLLYLVLDACGVLSQLQFCYPYKLPIINDNKQTGRLTVLYLFIASLPRNQQQQCSLPPRQALFHIQKRPSVSLSLLDLCCRLYRSCLSAPHAAASLFFGLTEKETPPGPPSGMSGPVATKSSKRASAFETTRPTLPDLSAA